MSRQEASLQEREPHPAARDALHWWQNLDPVSRAVIMESLASVALSGNRLAEICMSTIHRLEKGRPVSDRYLLGLCWTARVINEHKKNA